MSAYDLYGDDESITKTRFSNKKNTFKTRQKKQIVEKKEDFNKCLNYVLFLLNRKDYSLKEIEDKLNKHLYHQNDIDKVLKYIVENKYQSDERMAHSFVRNKKTVYGKTKIKQQLILKGIDKDVIEQAIYDEIDSLNENVSYSEDDLNYAENLLLKKFKNIEDMKLDKEKWFKKDKPKIIRFMLSRGFSLNDFKHLI